MDGMEWPVLFVVVMTLLFLAWVFGERPKKPKTRAEVIEMIEELRRTGGKK